MCGRLPDGALKFLDESGLAGVQGKVEVLHPEYGTRPRVHYLNIPGQFIAGTVYDPIEQDILEGAVCTLIDQGSGRASSSRQMAGRLLVQGSRPGVFDLRIEAGGFEPSVSSL